jgi:hypothetical protein
VFRKPFQAIGAGDGAEGAQLNDEERALLILRLHQVIRPFMLRRTKRDIDQTLRITYHDIRCPITFPQQHLLGKLRGDKQLPVVLEGRCVNRSVLTIEQSAQSLCNHAFMIPFFSQVIERERQRRRIDVAADNKPPQRQGDVMPPVDNRCEAQAGFTPQEEAAISIGCSGKLLILDLILRRSRSAGVKVVVFTHWLDCIDLLTEYFEAQGWKADAEYVALTGSSSAEERKLCVERFRHDPNCSFFLVSMKAGGCGLNLQVTHVIVMLDRDYTGTNEEQAIARVFRIGQKNVVRALYLLTNDVSEQRIMDIASRKDRPRHAIIEGGGYHAEAVTEEERLEALKGALGVGPAEIVDVSSETSLLDADVHRVFDRLIVPEYALSLNGLSTEEAKAISEKSASIAESLSNNNALRLRNAYLTKYCLPMFLSDAMHECSVDAERKDSVDALGRGKRDRSGFSVDDMVPDWFWDKLTEEGVDDDEIEEQWKAKRARERQLAELSSVSFASSGVRMLELSLACPSRYRRMPSTGVF